MDQGWYDRARAETIRYHDELYRNVPLGTAGSWLRRPHRLLGEAVRLLAARRPVTAHDLGAGVGRHALPLMHELPAGSRLVAVDLLDSALAALRAAAPSDLPVSLETRQCDLADFTFDTPTDLVVAFSAVEHLPDLDGVRALLDRIAAATAPGGVVAIAIFADRYEIGPDRTARPALLESAITAAQARDVLRSAFCGFRVVEADATDSEVTETRDGVDHRLSTTMITFLAQHGSVVRRER